MTEDQLSHETLKTQRNPLARHFQADCQAWYRHHTGHNYRGRQHVTIVIAQKYGGLRMARHIARIMPILDQIENAVRAEYQLAPLTQTPRC